MTVADPVTTRAACRIAADPTSTALLLAGPAAMDLWPGVRRVGDLDGRVLVEATWDHLADLTGVASGPTSARVRALPPRRTPTSFVTRFAWSGPGLPVTDGELVLGYAPGSQGPATAATLTLTSTGVVGSRLAARDLQEMAEGFLANLALAAQDRSHAA